MGLYHISHAASESYIDITWVTVPRLQYFRVIMIWILRVGVILSSGSPKHCSPTEYHIILTYNQNIRY